MAFSKREWQKRKRDEFKKNYGYSQSANYGCGGLREQVLERDGRKCVRCGMTAEEHAKRWNRPITIDHKNKDRKDNTMENLQTLCLRCHGSKDLLQGLRIPRVPEIKDKVLALRDAGRTYMAIAKATGFSIGAIYKWIQRWEAK